MESTQRQLTAEELMQLPAPITPGSGINPTNPGWFANFIAGTKKSLSRDAETLKQVAEGAVFGITTDLAGAPVDIANMVLAPATKALGIYTDKPAGGSDTFRKLVGAQDTDKDTAANTVGQFLSPAGLVKAGATAVQRIGKATKVQEATQSEAYGMAASRAVESLAPVTKTPNMHLIVPAERALSPKAYEKAKFLADTKVNNASLYNLTGAYREVDGSLVSVLSDEAVKLFGTSTQTKMLGDVVEAPKLFKAVPEVKDIAVEASTKLAKDTARYNPAHGRMGIVQHSAQNTSTDDIISMLTHEVQHGVADRFRLPAGGNATQFLNFDPASLQKKIIEARKSADSSVREAAERFKDAANKKLKQAQVSYENLPGEQMARFVQTVRNLDSIQLGAHLLKTLRENKTPGTWDTKKLP